MPIHNIKYIYMLDKTSFFSFKKLQGKQLQIWPFALHSGGYKHDWP